MGFMQRMTEEQRKGDGEMYIVYAVVNEKYCDYISEFTSRKEAEYQIECMIENDNACGENNKYFIEEQKGRENNVIF